MASETTGKAARNHSWEVFNILVNSKDEVLVCEYKETGTISLLSEDITELEPSDSVAESAQIFTLKQISVWTTKILDMELYETFYSVREKERWYGIFVMSRYDEKIHPPLEHFPVAEGDEYFWMPWSEIEWSVKEKNDTHWELFQLVHKNSISKHGSVDFESWTDHHDSSC